MVKSHAELQADLDAAKAKAEHDLIPSPRMPAVPQKDYSALVAALAPAIALELAKLFTDSGITLSKAK